jgi:ferredoxin
MEAGRIFPITLETPDGSRSITCGSDEYIWDAAFRHGIVLPAICRQGRCLECAAKVISGCVDHRTADAYLPQDAEQGFALLCRAHPCSALRILTHQASQMREHRILLGLPAPYA